MLDPKYLPKLKEMFDKAALSGDGWPEEHVCRELLNCRDLMSRASCEALGGPGADIVTYATAARRALASILVYKSRA